MPGALARTREQKTVFANARTAAAVPRFWGARLLDRPPTFQSRVRTEMTRAGPWLRVPPTFTLAGRFRPASRPALPTIFQAGDAVADVAPKRIAAGNPAQGAITAKLARRAPTAPRQSFAKHPSTFLTCRGQRDQVDRLGSAVEASDNGVLEHVADARDDLLGE